MKQEYLYVECYEILGVATNCSWSELRKTYKQKIHKWHPDRYIDESEEKQLANEKIKLLTSAYQQLARFYKKNGRLPNIEVVKKTPPKTQNKAPDTGKSAPTFRPAPSPTIKTRKKIHLSTLLLFGLAVTGGYLVLENQNITLDDWYPDDEADNAVEKKAIPDNDARQQPLLSVHSHVSKPSFGYGSKIGEVISIQGTPDHIEGNTWFYGRSEVHFTDGKVSSWHRDPEHPLNIGLGQ